MGAEEFSMTSNGARTDALRHLQASAVFGDLATSALERLASAMEPVFLPAGATLMTEGDDATDAFVVTAGRLGVYTRSSDGSEAVVAEILAGNIVGEMSLISGEPRSATVRALRDSHLFRLPGHHFETEVLAEREVLLAFTRTLARRLDRSIHGRSPGADLSVLTVVSAGSPPSDYLAFAADLAEAFGRQVAIIDSKCVDDRLSEASRDNATTALLHDLERDNDLVILVADPIDSPWTRRCLRQADLTLLVGTTNGLRSLGPPEQALIGNAAGLPLELVLLNERWPTSGTASVLALRAVRRHHHVELGSRSDMARLVRIISGTSIGLVLSGGGARGFAHLGVLRALIEVGVPVDHIGGASIGSSVAAAYAFGWDWDLMYEWMRYVTVDRGTLVDFSFPAISLATGDKLTSGMRSGYGTTDIEDTWYDFFCVSTDLTSGGLRVHRTGPLWKAVRSSVAIPGIFPPMRGEDGHVLVDGGVLANLPTAVMSDHVSPGTIIAIDLQGTFQLPSADLGDDGVTSGWKAAGRRLAPWASRMEAPRILDILSRCSSVSLDDATQLAGLVFRPPLDQFGLLEFTAHKAIVNAGYRHAMDTLEKWDGLSSLQAAHSRRFGL